MVKPLVLDDLGAEIDYGVVGPGHGAGILREEVPGKAAKGVQLHANTLRPGYRLRTASMVALSLDGEWAKSR